MSLICAVKGPGFIVLAADSRSTENFGNGKDPFFQDGYKKLLICESVAIASSGQNRFAGKMFVQVIEEMANKSRPTSPWPFALELCENIRPAMDANSFSVFLIADYSSGEPQVLMLLVKKAKVEITDVSNEIPVTGYCFSLASGPDFAVESITKDTGVQNAKTPDEAMDELKRVYREAVSQSKPLEETIGGKLCFAVLTNDGAYRVSSVAI